MGGVMRRLSRSTVIWSALLVGIGAALGSQWTQIREALAPVDTFLVLAVVAGVLLALAWRLGLVDRLRARRK